MLKMISTYLSLIRRRRGFLAGLGILLLVAVTCEVVAHTKLVWTAGQESERALLAGFGDAFVIAFVLALLVDPFVQMQLSRDFGNTLVWALLNPDSPPRFQEGLLDLLKSLHVYIDCCTYEMHFTDLARDPDEGIQFTLHVKLSGVALDQRGFRPSDKVFVASGYKGIPSHYCYWSFKGEDTEVTEYSEAEMVARGALSTDEIGRTVLDQRNLLPKEKRIPFKGCYQAERHVKVTSARSAYFPLFQAPIVLSQKFVITGPAVAGLDFTLIQLGTQRRPQRRAKGGELHFKSDVVAFPGQASILSWKPKATVESAE